MENNFSSFGQGVFHTYLKDASIARTKRPWEESEEDQLLKLDVKRELCLNYCSTPCPSKKLSRCFSDSACSPGFCDSMDNIKPGITSVLINSAVVPSVDTSRCIESEPDDSLLDLSDGEQSNSPFNYTDEQADEILAEDSLEAKQDTTKGNREEGGLNEREVRSNCAGASASSEDPKAVDVSRNIEEIKADHFLSQTGSSADPGHYLILGNEPTNAKSKNDLKKDSLKPNQINTEKSYDFDIKQLLNLTPIDMDLVDSSKGIDGSVAVGKEASQGVRKEELNNASKQSIEYEEIRSHNLLVGKSKCLTPKENSLGAETVEKLSPEIREACLHEEASTNPCGPADDQRKDDVKDVAAVSRKSSDSLVYKNSSKETGNNLPEKAGSQKKALAKGSSSVKPSDSHKVKPVVLDQNSGAGTTSGKKLGKVIPQPHRGERPKLQATISDMELEKLKNIYLKYVHAHVRNPMDCKPGPLQKELFSLMNSNMEYQTQEGIFRHPSDLTQRFIKKSTHKFSLLQWVNKNRGQYPRFQTIPGPSRFRRSSIPASSAI
uniref:S100P-binding protein n=1 Tax=Sphenodon punctatus TaxID=8508 RepID=A0A8D0FY08_SPHPU